MIDWANSRVHYEGARLLGRRHAPRAGFRANVRRLCWIFVRGYEYEICNRCGRPVGRCIGSWWEADNTLWLKINGRSEGVMCPPCFTAACERRGIWIAWRAVLDGPDTTYGRSPASRDQDASDERS